MLLSSTLQTTLVEAASRTCPPRPTVTRTRTRLASKTAYAGGRSASTKVSTITRNAAFQATETGRSTDKYAHKGNTNKDNEDWQVRVDSPGASSTSSGQAYDGDDDWWGLDEDPVSTSVTSTDEDYLGGYQVNDPLNEQNEAGSDSEPRAQSCKQGDVRSTKTVTMTETTTINAGGPTDAAEPSSGGRTTITVTEDVYITVFVHPEPSESHDQDNDDDSANDEDVLPPPVGEDDGSGFSDNDDAGTSDSPSGQGDDSGDFSGEDVGGTGGSQAGDGDGTGKGSSGNGTPIVVYANGPDGYPSAGAPDPWHGNPVPSVGLGGNGTSSGASPEDDVPTEETGTDTPSGDE